MKICFLHILRIVPLIFGALFTLSVQAAAVSANAKIYAEIISPAKVAVAASAELLFSASTGVLTLTIPGAGGSGAAGAQEGWLTLTSTGVAGNAIIFSITNAAALTTLALALATSGGSFGVNGVLGSGQGVHLVITKVAPGIDGVGRVYAIVAYN